jgi:hypothetical protein
VNTAIVYRPGWQELYQTDPELAVRRRIKPSGCYFMFWVRALSCHFDLPFTHSRVISFFDAELLNGRPDVTNEMFVQSPQALIDDLVGKGKVLFLGERPASYVCADNEIEGCCWHLAPHTYKHFVQGNGKGITIYDPWGPWGSDSVSDGVLLSKRVARIL